MPARPDILWILTTQWRAQACGYAGDENARTPVLDAWAAQCLNYTQAVTPHPFGPQARAAVLTGVPSPQNGVCDYFDPLPSEAKTVAHALQARGYETAFFGKWHLARRDPSAALVGDTHARMRVPPGERGGFAFWEGFESGFLLNDPWLQGTRLPEPVRVPGYQSDVLCRRAAEWWTAPPERAEGGRFMVVSLEAPHPPYDAPASGVARRDPVLPANVPATAAAQARRELAGYHAHIEATDRAIGQLLAAVGARTLVVFTSVHGDMHGAHGLFRKGWPYEESVRVPLLVRHPDEAPRRDAAPMSLLDLPAMTLAWAEGRSWRCPRRAAEISMPCVVPLPQQCDRVWRGVRTPTRKLVWGGDGAPWLFFDLENDPLELRNLAEDPAWAAERSALAAWAGA